MNRVFYNFRPGSGNPFRTVLRAEVCQLVARCGLGLMMAAAALPAQSRHASVQDGRKLHSVARTTRADSASAPQKPMPNRPPQLPAFSPDDDAPDAPRVSYRGGQLTIIAENSELSDILSLVSARTGAKIDLPLGTLHERVWSGFGPGPARKVLATLLSAMRLDYAIQASDIDPQGIRRVVIKARTKLDAGNVPQQENSTSLEPQPSPEAARADLQTASAEAQPSIETRESTPSDPPPFTEVEPREFQTSMEAANNLDTKYFRLDVVVGPNPHESIAEDQRMTVYIGQPVGAGGTTTEIPVNANKGALVRIWIGTNDKPPRLSREIFVGNPIRMPGLADPANEK